MLQRGIEGEGDSNRLCFSENLWQETRMAYVGLNLLSPSYTSYASNLNYLYVNLILPKV